VDLADLAERLQAKRVGAQLMARCPAHEDKTASLSLSQGVDGRVLVKCHTGCATEDVLARLGLEMKDLYPSSDHPRPVTALPPPREYAREDIRRWPGYVTEYEYRVGPAGPALVKVRRQADGRKTFSWINLRDSGKWRSGTGAQDPGLYRAERIPPAAAAGGTVYVVEGEKDVHTLEALGMVAVSAPHGAGPGREKWRLEYSQALMGVAQVVVLRDNDDVGKAYGEYVAEQVASEGTPVRIVDLPGVGEHGDVTDWCDLRKSSGSTDEQTRDALLDLIKGTDPHVRKLPPDRLEVAIIRVCLEDHDGRWAVISGTTADAFTDTRCRTIYQAILDREDVGESSDIITIDADLKASRKIDAAGGGGWVEWVQSTPIRLELVGQYIAQLNRTHTTRRVARLAAEASKLASDGKTEEALSVMTESTTVVVGRVGPKPHADAVVEALNEIEQEATGEVGMPTGFRELDERIGGLQPGRVTILTGHPGGGKSSLALQITLNVAIRGVRVHYWSREMRSAECARKLLGYYAGCYTGHHAVRKDGYNREHMRDVVGKAVAALPILIDDQTATLPAMIRQARRQRGNVALYVVDHAGLVQVPRATSTENEVSRVSRFCKADLAMAGGAHVLLLSQMNRLGAKGEAAALFALKSSSSLEQDADNVVEIRGTRFAGYDSNHPFNRQFRVLKSRAGQSGEDIEVEWDGRLVGFKERQEGDAE